MSNICSNVFCCCIFANWVRFRLPVGQNKQIKDNISGTWILQWPISLFSDMLQTKWWLDKWLIHWYWNFFVVFAILVVYLGSKNHKSLDNETLFGYIQNSVKMRFRFSSNLSKTIKKLSVTADLPSHKANGVPFSLFAVGPCREIPALISFGSDLSAAQPDQSCNFHLWHLTCFKNNKTRG